MVKSVFQVGREKAARRKEFLQMGRGYGLAEEPIIHEYVQEGDEFMGFGDVGDIVGFNPPAKIEKLRREQLLEKRRVHRRHDFLQMGWDYRPNLRATKSYGAPVKTDALRVQQLAEKPSVFRKGREKAKRRKKFTKEVKKEQKKEYYYNMAKKVRKINNWKNRSKEHPSGPDKTPLSKYNKDQLKQYIRMNK